jgi:oligoribonuclease
VLAWIDLEATSLVAAAHALLEVAAIVTDDQLAEVGRFHRVVYWEGAARLAHLGPDSPDEAFTEAAAATGINHVVVEMHARNGLWRESATSPHGLAEVDDPLAEFLAQTAMATDGATGQVLKLQIAGSSVWFDRTLMAVSLPQALGQFHYRMIDVTTLNELARRFWSRLHGNKPHRRELHRAMPDIEDSLALCRYYAGQIAKDENPQP